MLIVVGRGLSSFWAYSASEISILTSSFAVLMGIYSFQSAPQAGQAISQEPIGELRSRSHCEHDHNSFCGTHSGVCARVWTPSRPWLLARHHAPCGSIRGGASASSWCRPFCPRDLRGGLSVLVVVQRVDDLAGLAGGEHGVGLAQAPLVAALGEELVLGLAQFGEHGVQLGAVLGA